jgi:di/tricarboxylate transporter
MSGAFITIGILIGVVILFFTEIIPIAATALLVPVCLSLFGIMDADIAFSYLGNKWCIVFLALFMIGEAVFRTGFSTVIGEFTVKKAGKNPVKLMAFIMVAVGLMSAFLSNTGSTAVFIPIVLGVAASAGISPKKLLMPMAFASSLGGTLTLVGTPPNGVIASLIDETNKQILLTEGMQGQALVQFGFFEYGKVGIILFLVSITYMVIFGHKLLPEEELVDDIAMTDISDSSVFLDQSVLLDGSDGLDISDTSNDQLRKDKMWIAILVFVFVIVTMATGIIELQTAGVLGAVLCIATGCITMKEAFDSVSWTAIFVFAGLLPLSKAMGQTGATEMIAEWTIGLVSSPIGVLAVTYFLTALLTNFMSNMVATAMIAPIGLTIAQSLGFSPYPVLMATCMAASACFMTPIATPPNTIVLGPGGYKFRDYLKAGWPLQIISFIICMLVIPILFPF